MQIETNDKIIHACTSSRPLLDMLCPKRSGRYTKLEAYIDLLDRMQTEAGVDTHTGEVVKVGRGEFAVTITELSEKWNWHRATVRSFLDDLVALGEIRRELQKHCYRVAMVGQQRVSIPVDTPEDALDLCLVLFARRQPQQSDLQVLLPYAEQYCHLAAEASDGTEAEESGHDHLIHLVHSLVVSSFAAISHIDRVVLDPDVKSAMLATLHQGTPWSFTKWLQASALLATSVAHRVKPELDNEKHPLFTERDLPLLRRLHNWYVAQASAIGKAQGESSDVNVKSENRLS
ncbi:MAG: hypothetical protein Q4B58_06245 [Bacteroidales bacterium]|nr:hypothetical protein [Bacteroidales bacterium]